MIAPATTANGTKQATTVKVWGQGLALYHPNGSGSGSALELEPRVNRRPRDNFNCFFLAMAAQKTAATQKAPATFDWEHKLTVKLGFQDICEIVAVLEGKTENAGGSRNGLYHDNGQANTVITLQKNAERGGYFLSLSRKTKTDGKLSRIHMALSETEALGLRYILQAGLFFVTFHTHLFAAYAETQREEFIPDM